MGGLLWHETHLVCTVSSTSQGMPAVLLPSPPPEPEAEADVTPAVVVVAVEEPPPALEVLDPPVPCEVCPVPEVPPQATATTIAPSEAAQGASETSCLRARDPESTMAMVPPKKLNCAESPSPARGKRRWARLVGR
jgi:hypothetical protein